MTRKSLGETPGRFIAVYLAYGEGVIADDDIASEADEGLSRARLLIGSSVSEQVTVERLTAAVEGLNRMIGAEFFNAACGVH